MKRKPGPKSLLESVLKDKPPVKLTKKTKETVNKKVNAKQPLKMARLSTDEITEIANDTTINNRETEQARLPLAEGLISANDIEWIFNKVGGKDKLLEMVRDDPVIQREFFMMMLKGQAKTEELKFKKALDEKKTEKGGGRQKTRLFVIKGLHAKDDKKTASEQLQHILSPTEGKKKDSTSETDIYLPDNNEMDVVEIDDNEEEVFS